MNKNNNEAINSLRNKAFGFIEGIFSLGIATLETNRQEDSGVVCDGR